MSGLITSPIKTSRLYVVTIRNADPQIREGKAPLVKAGKKQLSTCMKSLSLWKIVNMEIHHEIQWQFHEKLFYKGSDSMKSLLEFHENPILAKAGHGLGWRPMKSLDCNSGPQMVASCRFKGVGCWYTGWWFRTCFPYIGNNHPY